MRMRTIIFFANYNLTDKGISGGDRIFIELIKNWRNKNKIILLGTEEAITVVKTYVQTKVKFISIAKRRTSLNPLALSNLLVHTLDRLLVGLLSVWRNRNIINKGDIIYSVSDFYPDSLPVLIVKLCNPKIKWAAAFFLFAPAPWAKDNPYKGRHLIKGFLYWLTQVPVYLLIKAFADYVFVTSKPDVKRFITKKRNRSKIIVVQGGVDISPSEPYLKSSHVIPIQRRKFDACFVGRFHHQKGVIDLIEIWRLVCKKRKSAKLAMVGTGSGPLEDLVKAKIKKHKLSNNIELFSFLDGERKYAIFKNSKIVVHPATYDSGGMAAAEAMAWGLPGVSYDLEALKTYYPKGMIKTKQGDLKQFSKNILKLLEKPKLYKKLSNEARKLIVDYWDWTMKSKIILSKLT